MPARRVVDDPAAELERIRAMATERKRKQRSRDAEGALRDGHVTQPQRTASPVTPPAPPVLPTISKEIERALEPFTKRGYVHSERFWELAAQQYPLLNLELEALKAADWLLEPKNEKRRCSKGFLSNWLGKADQDRLQREAAPPTFAQGRAVMTEAGPRRVPDAPGRPPDPDPVLPADVVLERIDPRVAQRALAAAKRLTLPEKLALVTNGRHP